MVLEITQKTMRTSMEVRELEQRKGKVFMSFVQHEHDSRKYFQKYRSYFQTQVDYCLVRRNQRKFSKGIKILPS